MQQNRPVPPSEPIIDDDLLTSVIQTVSESMESCYDHPDKPLGGQLDEEPVLRDFLAYRATRLAGKMALSGAPAKVVVRVCDEMNYLLNTTFAAVRCSQRQLYRGLLPEDQRKDQRTISEEPKEEAS